MTKTGFLSIFSAFVLLVLMSYVKTTHSLNIKDELNQLIAEESETNHLNGVVRIIYRDSIIYEVAVGDSDIESGEELSTSSIFKIGSITKQFTAALILKLAEENKLSINDSISHYLTGLNYSSSVSIRDLLNHTSGIPNYYFFSDYQKFKNLKQKKSDMYNRIKNKPLEFEPGSRYKYSNSGYYLLGLIIEKVTGKSWENVLDDYILQPLQLEKTKANWEGIDIAKGYKWNGKRLVNCDSIVPEVPYAAGSMVSTLDDLQKWESALLNGFISQEKLDEMTTSGLNDYGFGLWIDDDEGTKRIWHTGGIDGYRSMMTYYPERDLNIIILTSVEGYPVKQMEAKIFSKVGGVLINQ